VINPGGGWTPGSTVVIPGDQLGGATPANDLTLTVGSITTGDSTMANVETIFTGVIDEPDPGYYWYILELNFYSLAGTGPVNLVRSQLGFRSFTVQLVKQ
jgi:hypothetical protein